MFVLLWKNILKVLVNTLYWVEILVFVVFQLYHWFNCWFLLRQLDLVQFIQPTDIFISNLSDIFHKTIVKWHWTCLYYLFIRLNHLTLSFLKYKSSLSIVLFLLWLLRKLRHNLRIFPCLNNLRVWLTLHIIIS